MNTNSLQTKLQKSSRKSEPEIGEIMKGYHHLNVHGLNVPLNMVVLIQLDRASPVDGAKENEAGNFGTELIKQMKKIGNGHNLFDEKEVEGQILLLSKEAQLTKFKFFHDDIKMDQLKDPELKGSDDTWKDYLKSLSGAILDRIQVLSTNEVPLHLFVQFLFKVC